MDPETMDVAPSEDNGNTPAEGVVVETPSEPEPVKEEAAPVEPELYELPDGRKVDAATLSKEWKENFMPDYTKKSQELAKVSVSPEKPVNPYADPEYTPQTYEEILQEAERRALKAVEGKEQAKIESQKALTDAVEGQLKEIRATDPNLNEEALYQHAVKYGFQDLRRAHQNMRDMSEVVKKTQDVTAKNIAKRADPVSVTPGATGAKLDPSHFATSRDYLRALKGQ